MEVRFEVASRFHVELVAANAREVDVAEMEACGMSVKEALEMSLDAADWAIYAEVRGRPACMFGVTKAHWNADVGIPWMLGTNVVTRCARQLLKHSPRFIDEMLLDYPVLINMVHCDNKPAIRFLRRMGFRFGEPGPAGPNGEMFQQFRMDRGCVTPQVA